MLKSALMKSSQLLHQIGIVLKLFIYYYMHNVQTYVSVWVSAYHGIYSEVREKLLELLLSFYHVDSRYLSGHQAWRQVPIPGKPSSGPRNGFLLLFIMLIRKVI